MHHNRFLVDVRAAQEYSGLPEWRLYSWRRRGLVTPWRRGTRIMFDLREIPEKNHPERDDPTRWPRRCGTPFLDEQNKSPQAKLST